MDNNRGDSAKREKLRVQETLRLTRSAERGAMEIARGDTAICRTRSLASQ